MKKIIIILIVAALGYWGWSATRKPKEPQGPIYKSVKVTRGAVNVTVDTVGDVQPENRIELSSTVQGRLEEVLVKEGDTVKAGDILAWISSTERATLLDAALARGPAELARWKELYKPTPLVAPKDGQVIARRLEPGQAVSPESPIIVLSDRLIVLASVDETDIAQVYVNQEARIVLDSYPDEPLQARVSHVAYEATNKDNVITYEVDVLPEKVPDYMRSGMTAAVTFLGTSTNNVLVLPVETVRGDRFKRYVLSPGAPGKPPVETTIRTGLEDAKNVEILEGLAENDDVLVEDLEATMKQGARSTNPLNPFGRWSRRR